jgi:replicative DNA helicase
MIDQLDKVILKVLITNKKLSLDFCNNYDSKLFLADSWVFANSIIQYIKKYKELPTLRVLTEKLPKVNTKLIENTGLIWNEVIETSYDDKEYFHDLEKIKKRFAEKQIFSIREKLDNISGDINIDKTVSDIQKNIKAISCINEDRLYESKSVKDYLGTFVENFNNRKNNPTYEAGMKTGYSFIDYATNGIRPADMVLICGSSGAGKSLLLNNLGVQCWMQDNNVERREDFSIGKNIIYFSLEMPYEDCFNRFMSRLSGVPTRHIENPKFLSKEEHKKLIGAANFIAKYPYQFRIIDIINPSSNDLDLILDECQEDFDAIFVDYLGIMRTNENGEEEDWLKQGIISYELRQIGRKRNKPLFSAVQLNRVAEGKTKEKNIGLHRLARSATIATHATLVIQIEDREHEHKLHDLSYHLIKNRRGPKGGATLIKNLTCATLTDLPSDISADTGYTSDPEDLSEALADLEVIDI